MKRAALSLLFVAAVASRASADLTSDVRKLLADDKAIAKVTSAIQITRLGDSPSADQTIVGIDADKPMIPASNLKVITTAVALETLGHDFKFQTRLVSDGKDLAILGDGDPTLGDSKYLTPRGWTTLTLFEQWAEELKRQGVTRVDAIRVDDSIFEPTTFHPNWPRNQAHFDYVAEVAGLNLNANCLDVFATKQGDSASVTVEPQTDLVQLQSQLTVGKTHSLFLSRELGTNRVIVKGTINATNKAPFRVTIDDPPRFAGSAFKKVLQSHGIEVVGDVTPDRTVRAKAGGWRVVAVHETPLLEVLQETNKESNNLYAECVGKRAAAKASGESGSWANLAALRETFLKAHGVDPSAMKFDDGCGLSKENAVSPAAFVATLGTLFHSADRDAFMSTLSVGGTDGTLERRFHDDLKGRVFGKSGTVNGVSTLSGYLKSKSGRWFAFSILMNGTNGNRDAQAAQDKIVRAIDAAD